MKHRLHDQYFYDKKALLAATKYLEKKELVKNTINKPLVIAIFGIIFFIAFLLFVR